MIKSTLSSLATLQHKNADKKNKLSSDSEEAIIYVNPEDEIFHKVHIL
jgi:protein BCP1